MKKTLSIIGQFLLFFFADFVGSFLYHPFGIETKLPAANLAPRSFQWDGLILMGIVYLLFLVIEGLRKRLRYAARWSTLALALAVLAGYLLKFGFITHKW